MTVFISKRATLAAERIRAHWHEHADHRHIFDRELDTPTRQSTSRWRTTECRATALA